VSHIGRPVLRMGHELSDPPRLIEFGHGYSNAGILGTGEIGEIGQPSPILNAPHVRMDGVRDNVEDGLAGSAHVKGE
jgi:hypothetical protein